MSNSQAIVWIDSREARVFRFEGGDVRADAPFLALKHKTGALQAGRLADDLALLDRVIDALRGVRSWRLIGPDGARDYLMGYLERYKNRDGHIAHLLAVLAGVATVERPTDEALVEQVPRAFEAPSPVIPSETARRAV